MQYYTLASSLSSAAADYISYYVSYYQDWIPYVKIGSCTLLFYYHQWRINAVEANASKSIDTIQTEIETLGQYVSEVCEEYSSNTDESLATIKVTLDDLGDFIRNKVILKKEKKEKSV
tara:strand:+ start:194 stop:547 length:354 start_codon:yes stop_codon:yes gene_type:complete